MTISCIGDDCRVDKDTFLYKITKENGKKIKRKGPEHHLTFTREMCTSSKYLTHRVIPNVDATGVHLTEDIAAVLEMYNSVNTVKVVLMDNTSTNTGCEAGMVTALEKKKN